MSRRPLRGLTRLLSGLTAALTLGALITPAASADPPPPVLELSASTDSGAHLVGKPFPLTVSLHSLAEYPLTGLHVSLDRIGGSWLNVTDWAGLNPGGPGVTLDPGATTTVTLAVEVDSWAGPAQVRVSSWLTASDQLPAEVTVPVVDPATTTGSADGVVYGDRNGNHAFDPGEGLAGAKVQVYGLQSSFPLTTGADGAFTFTGPAQRYHVDAHELPGGWIAEGGEGPVFDVGGDQPSSGVQLRAVRPFSDKLQASASLDRTTYAPGDSAQVTVTLTNTSSETLTNVSGWCSRIGDDPDSLVGWKSWSDLIYPASLTFAPGETRTFTETGTVPPAADQYGGFSVSCDFGPSTAGPEGYPTIELWAKVPGTPAATSGWIYHDDNNNFTRDAGEAIAGTAVSLVDHTDGQVAATGQTDADGHVAFSAVPAGLYDLRVADGWVPVGDHGGQVQAGTCQRCGWEWSQIFTRA